MFVGRGIVPTNMDHIFWTRRSELAQCSRSFAMGHTVRDLAQIKAFGKRQRLVPQCLARCVHALDLEFVLCAINPLEADRHDRLLVLADLLDPFFHALLATSGQALGLFKRRLALQLDRHKARQQFAFLERVEKFGRNVERITPIEVPGIVQRQHARFHPAPCRPLGLFKLTKFNEIVHATIVVTHAPLQPRLFHLALSGRGIQARRVD